MINILFYIFIILMKPIDNVSEIKHNWYGCGTYWNDDKKTFDVGCFDFDENFDENPNVC